MYMIIKYDINWSVKKRGGACKMFFACQRFCSTLPINPGNINAKRDVESLSVPLSVDCQTVSKPVLIKLSAKQHWQNLVTILTVMRCILTNRAHLSFPIDSLILMECLCMNLPESSVSSYSLFKIFIDGILKTQFLISHTTFPGK